jgi:hypothetical protein
VQVNREGTRASAAAYLLQGNVEQAIELQGLDPDTIDEATMGQLIDEAWPASLDQAEAWLSTLDPSVFDAQLKPPSSECLAMGCPEAILCDSKFYKKEITCFLQACGDGACNLCPDWFGPLKNLGSNGWCSYVCMDGPTVVGSAGLVKVPILGDIQFCLLP